MTIKFGQGTIFARSDAAATVHFITQFVWLLFESGYYSRALFIKLRTEDEEIHCLKQGGVAADARESIRRDTATLANDVEEDEDELEENKLVLEDC